MAQQEKLQDLKVKLADFMNRLDKLDPERTSVEDIDHLLSMLDELEKKLN